MIVDYVTRRVAAGLAVTAAIALLALPAAAQTRPTAPKIGDPPEALNMRLVGSNDLQGRTAYQPTVAKQGSRYILYVGHHGGSGDHAAHRHVPLETGRGGGLAAAR